MDFLEFKRKALNPTITISKAIYQVKGFLINEEVAQKKSFYPKFSLFKVLIGFVEKIIEGENMIKDFIKSNQNLMPYCFYITRYPIGLQLNHYEDEDAFSQILYNAEGRVIEKSVCSSEGHYLNKDYCIFRGRLSTSLRFKEGDIVEVRNGNQVELGVVSNKVMTIERCWDIWVKNPERYLLDSSDDQYTINFNKDIHSHISPLNLMSPRFPVPDYLRKKFLKIRIEGNKSD